MLEGVKKTQWWNEEVKRAVNGNNRLFIKWMKNRSKRIICPSKKPSRRDKKKINERRLRENWQ